MSEDRRLFEGDRRRWLCLALGAALGACTSAVPAPVAKPAVEPPRPPQGTKRRLQLPEPEGTPRGGRFILDSTAMLRPWQREAAVMGAILSGRVPPFLRELVPIELAGESRRGRFTGRVYVTPDYLSVGTDEDFVRIPITIRSAQRLGREIGCALPTRQLVDRIYEVAAFRIGSPHQPPGPDMGSNGYILEHNDEIETRRRAAGAHVGRLLAGCKKDVVLSRRMLATPGRTPIYGWFAPDGHAIQPLSLVHDDRHVDYAHGIRFVDRSVEIDGQGVVDLLDVLRDASLSPLLSDEGTFDLRYVWDRRKPDRRRR